jgi:hypothetical protein
MDPTLQPHLAGKRRARIYGRGRIPLPPPPGRIGDGSTRASVDLITDLRVLIDAGLVRPVLGSRTIRYAVAEASDADPATNEDV